MKNIIVPNTVDWDLLKRFLICAKSKTFVQAAEKCATSPDALRKQMFRLEEQLNEKVFVRFDKKVLTHLTPFGQALEKKARIARDFLMSKQPIEESYFRQNDIDKIEVFTTQELLNTVLFPCFKEFFKQKIENVQFFFETSKTPQKIQFNQIHIRSDFFPQRNTVIEKIFDFQRAYYASENYIENQKEDELAFHEFIHHHSNLLFNQGFSSFHKIPYIVSDDFQFSVKICVEGLGVLALPKKMDKPREILPITTDQIIPSESICLAYLQQIEPSNNLKNLINFLKNFDFEECQTKNLDEKKIDWEEKKD